MLITNELLNNFVGQGGPFEAMLHGLVRVEAWACGIRPDQIDWDYRTNIGDGGRDILIRVGNSSGIRKFIPPAPSVWSAKSGADGLKPWVLRREVTDHPKVLAHLRGGGAYVWCVAAPADNDDARDKLREEAAVLAREQGFDSEHIVFFFRDTITAWLNQHVGVASIYLDLPRGWKTLDEWRKRDRNFGVPWVEFGDRAALVTRIQEHLLGSSGPNVIHLAGWSGIGKTRTVLHACLGEPGLEGSLYFPTLESFTSEAEDYLARNEGIRAAVIVDEVEMGDWSALRERAAHYGERVRIVTVGSGTKEGITLRDGVVVVPTPESSGGVSEVIRSADATLSAEQAAHLARWCDHDLRLALLLVEANRQDPGLTEQPISSVEDVWRRVLNLFREEIGDVHAFRVVFEALCVSVDIGNSGEPRRELQYLSEFFGKPEADFDRVIAQAIDCGLGRQQGRFFEPGPRALVRRVFERSSWPRLRSTASRFIGGMPSLRLQKRFVERGHESSSAIREEIGAALTAWFYERFPTHKIELLSDRQSSRVFAAYAELNPALGLAWLQRAVERASPEELLAFDAQTDGSGFWRGRRQAVWLCEHLAQFPEYFWQCEAILFHLGLHETEERTSNNSRGVWQRFFRPVFSWTATPFEERIEHLGKRIGRAEVAEQPMIMGAALEAVKAPTGETIPPNVVGGRLAPQEWCPKTNQDIKRARVEAAAAIFEAVKGLSADRVDVPRSTIIDNLGLFLSLGCLEQLRDWLSPAELDEDTLRRLRIKIDSHLDFLRLRATGSDQLDIHPTERQRAKASEALPRIEAWRNSLEPKGLESRIREVTGRERWEHKGTFAEDREEQTSAIYEHLAAEVVKSPQVMDRLREWFDSDRARSAFEFGSALARHDDSFVLLERMVINLIEDRATNLLIGYFDGVKRKFRALPEPLSQLLDTAGEAHPLSVTLITLQSDISDAGFERLLRVAPLFGPNPSARLAALRYGEWAEKLSEKQKAQVVELLASLGRGGDLWAYKVALDLITYWGHKAWEVLPERIASPVTEMLEACLEGTHHFDAWDWPRVMRKLPPSHNLKKIDLLTKALIGRARSIEIHNDALNMLCELAKDMPEDVMRSVGARALEPETGPYFLFSKFHGLFEDIGLDVVRRWIEGVAGVAGARAIARHVDSPLPVRDNIVQVPPLTEWLLSEFEDDDQVFNQFCAGRHDGEMYVGSMSRYFEDTEERMKPYLNHPLRRIREWAQYEVSNAQGVRIWEGQREAEFGRD
jgi:hypothetical protein